MTGKSWVIAFIVLAISCLSQYAFGYQEQEVDLRGYGKVTARFSQDRAEFICQDESKADILMGKLIADLFWDAGETHVEKSVSLNDREIVIHTWNPYGAIITAMSENRVVVIGADSEEELLELIKREPLLFKTGVQFKPSKPYPLFLDFYDLRAYKAYTHAMESLGGEGLDSHWPFIKRFGIGGLAFQGLGFHFQCPAPGVFDGGAADYEIKESEKNGGLIVPCFSGGGEVPFWVYNKFPFSMMQPSPTALLSAWGGAAAAGAHYESWGMLPDEKEAGAISYLKMIMERYKDSPAIGGWHIYAGSPGAEMGFHERTTEFWDHSISGQQGFRQWLANVKNYSLKELGKRWHNDENHFKSWEEVTVPDINSFFGDLSEDKLRISTNWKWMKAGKEQDNKPPAADATDWISVAMPPSQQQNFLPWGDSFYHTTFDAEDWLKDKEGKDIYLICAVNIRSNEGTSVWFNGEYLGQHKSKTSTGGFGLKVTGLIRKENNELILNVPSGTGNIYRDGKIFGPVFLTITKPNFYPYLGREGNACYVDLKEWQAYGIYNSHVHPIKMARSIDSERPMILTVDIPCGLADYAMELATHYGMGIQDSGREAWERPWWPRLGYVAGFYGASEPSNTTRGKSLDRLLGWILIDGDSSHSLFYTLENYIQIERETGWFTKNKRLIQLFGKSLPEKPSIVILRSVKSMLLGSEIPWNWDIGRGDELRSAHYDCVYATEREVQKGLIDDYPVLFDSGTEYMDEDLVKAITKYVDAGGTFIALNHTGKHTFLEPDTYPISMLTGFKVISTKKAGKIRFEHNLPLFKTWEGKEFGGEGVALDWMNNDSAKGVGLELEPAAKNAIPLARWEDGSVAIGYRQIGKGKVIVLGSTFWRYGRDFSGVWRSQSQIEQAFFERLFTDLKVERNTYSSSRDVWARKVITKNGLQEWVIAYNSGDADVNTEISFRIGNRPNEVWDMVEQKSVEFSFSEDGWVKIKDVAIPGLGVKVYGVKRGNFLDGIPFWWAEKTTYWKRCDVKTPIPIRTTVETIPFEKWRLFPDKENTVSQSSDWQQASFDDSDWQWIQSGPWNLLDESLNDYQDTGLYRARFSLPKEWIGHKVVLGLYSFNTPIVYDHGEFFINEEKVTTYQARGWNQTFVYDVTDKLKNGENVLAVKVKGGKQFSGIVGAVWMGIEKTLEPAFSLSGEWQVVLGDYLTKEIVNLPGKTKGKYLFNNVKIPSDWKDRDVYLHVETQNQWLSSVVVNGHPINYNSSRHPFGLRTDINITPYLHIGKENRIELWPYGTIPFVGSAYEDNQGTEMEISMIQIGGEKK